MKEQVDKIERRVDEIHEALVGNELAQKPGLISQVQKNTAYRKAWAKRMGILGTIFASVGAGFKWLVDWFQH